MRVENLGVDTEHMNYCPKCRGRSIGRRYYPAGISITLQDTPEYMLYWCLTCEYSWRGLTYSQMVAAELAKKEVPRENMV